MRFFIKINSEKCEKLIFFEKSKGKSKRAYFLEIRCLKAVISRWLAIPSFSDRNIEEKNEKLACIAAKTGHLNLG